MRATVQGKWGKWAEPGSEVVGGAVWGRGELGCRP